MRSPGSPGTLPRSPPPSGMIAPSCFPSMASGATGATRWQRGTYGDAEVARFVNEHFIPIRVDTDHRPDINARYNVGGWPTTSFLTPHGGYIAGATYLPPDQFLAMLDEVRRAYAERKPELYEQANDILRQRREHAGRVAAGREPDAALVDAITRRVAGTYDPMHGGFGVRTEVSVRADAPPAPAPVPHHRRGLFPRHAGEKPGRHYRRRTARRR